MTSRDSEGNWAVFALFLMPFLWVGGLILKGWVLVNLWSWFVVDLGLPQIGMIHAIGLALIIGYLTYQWVDVQQPDRPMRKELAIVFYMGIVRPLLIYAMGWFLNTLL